ncbi:ABC transporter permease [Candidatus Woesearchaeota archaeon]|nr:ABC transporter permease [Candidatus Woesearchaeota archaeon]
MIKDYVKFALKTLKVRKTRTFLTMLAVFIGIAAIVSLISLGQGLENAISEQFEALGTNKIMVSPAGTFFGAVGDSVSEITEEDLDVIQKVSKVKQAGGMLYKMARLEFDEEVQYTWAIGLPTDESGDVINEIATFNYVTGRELKESDKYKVVVGIRLAEADIFDKEVKVRDKLKIEGYEFKVVGGMGRIGNPEDDRQVYIPLETAREVFNEPDKLDIIMIETTKGASVPAVVEDIKKELRDFREVEEGEEDFNVQTFEEMMETFAVVFTLVQAILIGIASISLLVGGVSIMNTMYTSVLQRTREIGVMKAIGAKNKDIWILFIIESGFLGMAGGIIGVLIGMGLAKLVELAAFQQGITILKAQFPWYLIVGTLVFSFVIGCLSGLAPAYRASKLKPVDALRYE